MDEMRHPAHGERSASVVHEETDINVRMVLWIVVAFIVLAVVIHFAVGGLFHIFKAQEVSKQQQAPTLVRTARRLPELVPLLQPFPYKIGETGTESPLRHTPASDMETLRRQQDQQLNSYGWVDQKKGTVHIPIDRARHLFVEMSHGAVASAAIPPAEASSVMPPPPATSDPKVKIGVAR